MDFKKFGLELLISCLSVLVGVKSILVVVGILLFFDMLTGVWAALVKQEEIHSKKLGHTVTKMIIYQITIISAFLIEKYIITQIPITEVVAGFLALVELKSISENVLIITGLDFFNAIKQFLHRESGRVGVDKETIDKGFEFIEKSEKNIK
jgi:hypothetical protein